MRIHIEYKGVSHVFESDKDENPSIFNDRCWFIVLNPDKIHLVDIYINEKHYGVTYPEFTCYQDNCESL